MGGRVTMTLNEQVFVLLQLSVAVTLTRLVPMGNVLPLGGDAKILMGAHPLLALTLKKTVAPPGPVAVARTSVEHKSTREFVGGLTVTWKVHVFVLPQVSYA